jgi:hypothetical protein
MARFLIGICFARYIYCDIDKMHRMGRDQFLEARVAAQNDSSLAPLGTPGLRHSNGLKSAASD